MNMRFEDMNKFVTITPYLCFCVHDDSSAPSLCLLILVECKSFCFCQMSSVCVLPLIPGGLFCTGQELRTAVGERGDTEAECRLVKMRYGGRTHTGDNSTKIYLIVLCLSS
jgi:hypothetical protein